MPGSTSPFPLGFIPESQRTQQQQDAHNAIVAMMPRFTLTPITMAKGESVRLTKGWTSAEVIADVGREFVRFHQITGSCVGAGGGNALLTLISTQRLIATNPTKAFIPFWPFNYGRSRYYAGDRNPGEGSMGATFFKSVVQDGIIASTEQGLPQFTSADGFTLTKSLEYTWSDGDSQTVTAYMNAAKPHPLGNAAQIQTVDQIKAAIQNGYPCTFACNNYIGNASIQGSGADACVVGYWDHYGPHQQSVHDYWEHPNLGPLYWVQNNWPGSTYPRDPAGGPVCGCWVLESRVEQALRLQAEVFPLSHLAWFPAQPSVMNYYV